MQLKSWFNAFAAFLKEHRPDPKKMLIHDLRYLGQHRAADHVLEQRFARKFKIFTERGGQLTAAEIIDLANDVATQGSFTGGAMMQSHAMRRIINQHGQFDDIISIVAERGLTRVANYLFEVDCDSFRAGLTVSCYVPEHDPTEAAAFKALQNGHERTMDVLLRWHEEARRQGAMIAAPRYGDVGSLDYQW